MVKSLSKTICFFNSNKAWGGGEKWHFNTAKEFKRRGYESLLVTNQNSKLRQKGIEENLDTYSFSISNISFLNPIKIFVLFLFFKAKKIEVVILNLPADVKVAGVAAKLAGVKKIIYRRGMPHPIRNTVLNRFLFKSVLSDIIANSEEIKRSITQGNEDWFPYEKVHVIYNGVDSAAPIPVSKKIYEKKSDEIVIGNAGRLTEQKGQKYLIELGSLLKYQGTNFQILIAGDGELRNVLQKQIDDLHLSENIKLLGHVDDMSGFFKSLDVFVFPSIFEGSANTLIETLYFRVPTVAWDISSNPEIIVNGVNGFLAKPFDTHDLKEKLFKALAQSESIIESGEKILKQKFDTQTNLTILTKMLTSKIS